MFSKILNILKGDWLFFITFALAVVLWGTGIVKTKEITSLRSQLAAEQEARKSDRLTYEKAQAEAESLALKNKIEKEKEYAQKAKQADERAGYWRDRYSAALVRYQGQVAPSPKSDASTIHLSGTSEFTYGDYRSSDRTDILITLNDAQICSDNTARLQAIREWALNQGN